MLPDWGSRLCCWVLNNVRNSVICTPPWRDLTLDLYPLIYIQRETLKFMLRNMRAKVHLFDSDHRISLMIVCLTLSSNPIIKLSTKLAPVTDCSFLPLVTVTPIALISLVHPTWTFTPVHMSTRSHRHHSQRRQFLTSRYWPIMRLIRLQLDRSMQPPVRRWSLSNSSKWCWRAKSKSLKLTWPALASTWRRCQNRTSNKWAICALGWLLNSTWY